MKIFGFIKRISVFFLTLILCALIISFIVVNKINVEKLTMEQLLLSKSTRVSDIISHMVYYRANMLSAIVTQNDEFANDFNRIAPAMLDDPSVLYVLAAPSGVVTNIYPLRENEFLLGMNILSDGIGVDDAIQAKESGRLVLGGPFDITQGVQALIARLPVYVDKPDGTKDFWGLVSVALKFPQVMDDIGLDELQMQGFSYNIYKIESESNDKQMIAGDQFAHMRDVRVIEKKITILNDEWHFRIYSLNPWYSDSYVWILILAGVCLSFLVALLQVMAIKAKEASKTKSDFLASMSHEIRTPMNAIIGMSELLTQENLNKRQQEYVSDIKTSSTALLGIINDILDVSKIEAGKLTITHVHFSLQHFTKNVAEIMSHEAKSKGLEFILEMSESTKVFVYGDDVRLRQILINLLGNAIKFTDAGFVKLTTDYSEDIVHFTVSDTGTGIKAADLKFLYDSFAQFDPQKNRGKQGTGLGLSITKSLIDMMGGQIQANSVYGEGTTFIVDIPMSLGDENKLAYDNSAFGFISAKDADVLLVEDNEINRKVAVGLLRLNGIECDIAINGIEAIQKVQKKNYDIVFMDHMMPEMDGIEATFKIRELGGEYKRGKLAIIALTSNIVPTARKLFIDSGMDDFLAKPIDKFELSKILMKWLPAEKQNKDVQPKVQYKEVSEKDYSLKLRSACTIEGLDVALGLSHVSSMEDYERSLRLLGSSIPRTITELDSYLKAGELDRFAICIHGMKGALAINGHIGLSDMAKVLESESKNKNIEYCISNFPGFSNELNLFGEAVNDIFQIRAERQKLAGDRELMIKTLAIVEDCIEGYDRDGALKELEGISAYSFGGDVDDKLKQLIDSLEDFDFELAAGLLQRIEL